MVEDWTHLLSTTQVAEALDMLPANVKRDRRAGLIEAYAITSLGHLFHPDEVERRRLQREAHRAMLERGHKPPMPRRRYYSEAFDDAT